MNNFKVGDVVNYHSISGEPATSSGHEITAIERAPNNYGCDVAFVTGKRSCIALDNLSNDENPMKPYEKPKKLTRSQQNYQDYLRSESDFSFAEWMGFKV